MPAPYTRRAPLASIMAGPNQLIDGRLRTWTAWVNPNNPSDAVLMRHPTGPVTLLQIAMVALLFAMRRFVDLWGSADVTHPDDIPRLARQMTVFAWLGVTLTGAALTWDEAYAYRPDPTWG